MKLPFIRLVVLLLGALTQNAAALDLTPRQTMAAREGAVTLRQYFEDKGRKLGFRADPAMTIGGNDAEATVRLTDLDSADMKITKRLPGQALPFDESGLAHYRAMARSAVPAGSTKVEIEQEVPEALSINDWKSHQFLLKYIFYGREYRSSVTFVNYSREEQLIVTVGAPAPDYEQAYARCYRFLNSLYEFQPDEEIKPQSGS